MELTILLPCLNEQETLAICIQKAYQSIESIGVLGEVLIADNGSTDGSLEIAESLGARIVQVEEKGYGAALMGGIKASNANYVIMGDADDSYALDDLKQFYAELLNGNDLVMGNRFKGGIDKGAMPFLHKYLGNPVLSWLGRLLFNSPIKDFHCGLRAFNRKKIIDLGLKSQGMEFASEMIVKATLMELKIVEVPTILMKDGRSRKPHLNTWRDGWRHLIFLLASSPRWLFLFPSLFILATGGTGMFLTGFGSFKIMNIYLDSNFYLISAGIFLTGVQLFLSSILVRIFSSRYGFLPNNRRTTFIESKFTLERGISTALFLVFLSSGMLIFLLSKWTGHGFNGITAEESLKMTGLLLVTFCTGVQIFFASFFASILQAHHQ